METKIPDWRKFYVPVAEIKKPGDLVKIPLRENSEKKDEFSTLKYEDIRKYFPDCLRVHASTSGNLQSLDISAEGTIENPKEGWASIDVLLVDHTLGLFF